MTAGFRLVTRPIGDGGADDGVHSRLPANMSLAPRMDLLATALTDRHQSSLSTRTYIHVARQAIAIPRMHNDDPTRNQLRRMSQAAPWTERSVVETCAPLPYSR